MSTAFTPGPWTIYEPESGVTYGISGDDGTAVVFWGETVNDGINKIEDARLIAAAPDLLEALQAIIDTGFAGGPQGHRAKAAIAKATGEAA